MASDVRVRAPRMGWAVFFVKARTSEATRIDIPAGWRRLSFSFSDRATPDPFAGVQGWLAIGEGEQIEGQPFDTARRRSLIPLDAGEEVSHRSYEGPGPELVLYAATESGLGYLRIQVER